jgi:hypothetical protein
MNTRTLAGVFPQKNIRAKAFKRGQGTFSEADPTNEAGMQETQRLLFEEKVVYVRQILSRQGPDNLGIILEKTDKRLVTASPERVIHIVIQATMLDVSHLFWPNHQTGRGDIRQITPGFRIGTVIVKNDDLGGRYTCSYRLNAISEKISAVVGKNTKSD